LSRWATEAKIRSAISASAPSRKSIAAYAASSENPGQPSTATRSATQRVPASFEPGSQARCATSAKQTRSTASTSNRRPAATARSAAPMPSRSHNRSSVHTAPSRRESSTSTSAAAAAATAAAGSRNREIEATSRASPARSTVSARPKLWITLATGLPVCGCRSLCASCR